MDFAHIGFCVKDLQQSINFYTQALEPLGIVFVRASDTSAHFGKGDGRTTLWIHTRGTVSGPLHIAFEADTKEQVDDFYHTALSAGGKDNGSPGIRANYSPKYYAAFVIDLSGNNLEAVYRG